jgi:hypothetical protein
VTRSTVAIFDRVPLIGSDTMSSLVPLDGVRTSQVRSH